jgi:hypothetical protein
MGDALGTSNDSGTGHVAAPGDGRTPENWRGLTELCGIVVLPAGTLAPAGWLAYFLACHIVVRIPG